MTDYSKEKLYNLIKTKYNVDNNDYPDDDDDFGYDEEVEYDDQPQQISQEDLDKLLNMVYEELMKEKKKEEEMKKRLEEEEDLSITEIEDNVLEYIIGQNKQVRQIITSIYRGLHFKRIKSNTLIIGNSGTGKTATIKQIASILNIPYTIEDATDYTKEGYVGSSVKDMVFNLIINANGDLKKAEKGIIVIDEIDKKASRRDDDVAGVEVLKSMLKLVEGTKIKIPVSPFKTYDFDTKDITIIFMGAFPGLDKIREKRLDTNQLGFSVSNQIEKSDKEKKYSKEDLIEFGMLAEFVGRIDMIIEMNQLTKEDLAEILRRSKLSVFRLYEEELLELGVELVYNDEIFDKIAEASLAIDTGARELSNTVNYIFENIIYEVFANPGVYAYCVMDMDIVDDNNKFDLS